MWDKEVARRVTASLGPSQGQKINLMALKSAELCVLPRAGMGMEMGCSRHVFPRGSSWSSANPQGSPSMAMTGVMPGVTPGR